MEGSFNGISIRPDIDEAFAALDPKGQASMTGLRTPRAVRKGLEQLPGDDPERARGHSRIRTDLADISEVSAEISRAQHTQAPVPVADELAKLASLRQGGLLSNAEFEMEKSKLLGGR